MKKCCSDASNIVVYSIIFLLFGNYMTKEIIVNIYDFHGKTFLAIDDADRVVEEGEGTWS